MNDGLTVVIIGQVNYGGADQESKYVIMASLVTMASVQVLMYVVMVFAICQKCHNTLWPCRNAHILEAHGDDL